MKLTNAEIDIQIAGTRLYDYLDELLYISEKDLRSTDRRNEVRIKFGEACVELTRAIQYAIKNKAISKTNE